VHQWQAEAVFLFGFFCRVPICAVVEQGSCYDQRQASACPANLSPTGTRIAFMSRGGGSVKVTIKIHPAKRAVWSQTNSSGSAPPACFVLPVAGAGHDKHVARAGNGF